MPEGGRRLAAIMFTDMVGYTALTQANEKLALEVLARHHRLVRPIFPKFGGREIKTIGDSFLVEFDSALEATNCAVEIQRFLHDYNTSTRDEWKVRLRIGIHLGDVVHVGEDVLGDAVNIASRIEPLADAEGLCVSGQVFDQVRNKISQPMLKLPSKDLKNLQFQIDVYKVVMPWEESLAKGESHGKHGALRIAVLPFANMSPDPDDEYFADGMTEELIDRLSQVRELKVIARTSIMGYKKKEKKVSEIADELGVGTLVEGSVRKAGNKIRITVQLIDTNTEDHLWSSRYDKDFDDVFAIQSEISQKVTEELRVHLVGSEKRVLEKKPTQSEEAYALYLKGRYYWNERTKPAIERGIAYLEKALQIDPGFALAYSDMADAYVIMGDNGILSQEDASSKVEEYARRALAIDPSLSQPHACLGLIHRLYFRWADAETEYKLAIHLKPNNTTARNWYALDLAVRGESGAAEVELRKAKEMDPLSPILDVNQGYLLVRTGRWEEGLEILRRVSEINEPYETGLMQLGYAYVVAGKKDQAYETARKLQMVRPAGEHTVQVADIYASTGRRKEAVEILDRLVKDFNAHYVDPAHIAMVYAALGDKTNALQWLAKAVKENSYRASRVSWWPSFDSFRNNPEFIHLIEQMGLEKCFQSYPAIESPR